jgi:hypothetical protein
MSGILHISARRWACRGAVAIALALAALGTPVAPAIAAGAPAQAFASPQAAADALNAALAGSARAQVLAVLGPAAARLVASGDPVADQNARKAFLAAYAARHALEPHGDGRTVLVIGDNDWPFPIPIVRTGDAWRFDTAAGAQELINRRIGRNELSAIRTLLAVVVAQNDYFARSQAGGKAGVYARRFISARGKTNGLYWAAGSGEQASPLAALVQDALTEGYPGSTDRAARPRPYHGYQFRMLTAQGPDAPGGAGSYLVNGQLSGGFAVLAWPAQYGNSGVVSFVVNGDGIVFQKDLGPATPGVIARIRAFDPDPSWARVDVKNE